MTTVSKIPSITVGLRPFAAPASGSEAAVSALFVTLSALPGGGAKFVFALEGRMDALRLPTGQTPFSIDQLWQHTCFEVFLTLPDKPAYREFNLSPTGQWFSQRFVDYRHLDRELSIEPPRIQIHQDDRSLTLTVELPGKMTTEPQQFKVGLAAVIEHADGHLDYWALCHPGDTPDFHLRESWTLALDALPLAS
jgi:hypothetical protein